MCISSPSTYSNCDGGTGISSSIHSRGALMDIQSGRQAPTVILKSHQDETRQI